MARRAAGEGQLRRRPNGSWEGRYTAVDGRRRSVYRRTKREAVEALREALRAADHGVPVLDSRLTTEAYLLDWLEHVIRPGRRPTTYRAYRQTVDLYLIPHLGKIALAKLAPEHVQKMLASMEAKPPTKRYARTVLRSALTRAEKHGRVHRNAAALVDAPPVEKKVPLYFSAEEVRLLIKAAKGKPIEPLLLTALGTGARLGELLALAWSDIDGDAAMIRRTMQADGTTNPPKTESSVRDITLPHFVVVALQEHQRGQVRRPWQELDLVFARPDGQPMLPTMVRDRFSALLKVAGLPHRPFHALRHTYTTLQHEAGEDIGTISKLLGHASIATTMNVYSHLAPKTRRRAAANMDAVLTG